VNKRILLFEVFLLAIIVAIAHKMALSLYLYWTISWFDILMHFLGGALIALLALFFIYDKKFFHFDIKRPIVIFSIAVGSVLIVGLSWELWELYFGMSDIEIDKWDTVLDLIMDILGAVFAYFYARNKICRMPN
jgi:hypothetical protein